MEQHDSTVLLTGVTGFLGSHTTIQLLEKGYQVVGTLRDKSRAPQIKKVIARHASNIDIGRLEFAEADLTNDEIWDELMPGIDYVQHIASPFPRELPDHEDELIVPAKQGALNVLKASAKNSVQRVVMTSSIGAIVYGKQQGSRSGTYTESDWTDPTNRDDTTPYFRSKTIAEQAAWEFMESAAGNMELATVCPGAILGPVLEKDFGTSANIVIKLLDGSTPRLPKLGFDIVDVRSVADLQIRAMEHPKAGGERFIGAADYLKFKDIGEIIKQEYPDRSIPTKTIPGFLVRLFSLFDPTLKPVLLDLGVERKVDSSKARSLLQWQPLPGRQAVLSCARSVMELGIV